MPFLKHIRTLMDKAQPGQYPFTIPAFSEGIDLELRSNVTFLVGENGSGKSTLLEAIADHCGFNSSGGNRNHRSRHQEQHSELAAALRLSWMPKLTRGFFMRAESFYNFATYIDELAMEDPGILNAYGGKSLHHQSHGESFLALFINRFDQGIYLLDEPEAALSPSRQLTFLILIHELESANKAQFILATHSPILLSYPGATIFSLDGGRIQQIDYKESQHYRLTLDFLKNPEVYLRRLFEDNME